MTVGCKALEEFKAAGQTPQHQQQHAKHRCTFEALVLKQDALQVGVRVCALFVGVCVVNLVGCFADRWVVKCVCSVLWSLWLVTQ